MPFEQTLGPQQWQEVGQDHRHQCYCQSFGIRCFNVLHFASQGRSCIPIVEIPKECIPRVFSKGNLGIGGRKAAKAHHDVGIF